MTEYDCKQPPKRIQNLIGETYAQLTVIGYSHAEKIKNRTGWRHYWFVRCTCGTVKKMRSDKVKQASIVSCGCHKNALLAKLKPSQTHGMSKTPEYGIWCNMKERCNNPNNRAYQYYGGRGITICTEWDESFEIFYEDMGPRPSDNHTIERIDNDGNYEPDNCKWATRTEQIENRSNTRYLTIDGVTKPLGRWVKEYDMDYQLVFYRLQRGWDKKRALTEPVN